jgi:hypothetical protein
MYSKLINKKIDYYEYTSFLTNDLYEKLKTLGYFNLVLD